jgi:hypothetical protein
MKMYSAIRTLSVWALVFIGSLFALAIVGTGHAAGGAMVAGTWGVGILFGTVSLFETRTMLQMLEQMLPPKTFLLDTFFPTMETSETKYVDIDIIKGKRRMAPFVKPLAQGKMVERIGFTTKTFEPPYIKMKRPCTAADILKRQPGDTIYQGGSSPAERAAMQLGKDLADLRDMIIRRKEWMAAQALTSGKIAVTGEGFNAEIDFGMDSGHKVSRLSSGDRWDSTGDPIKNLRTWKRKITQDSGLVPNVALFGSSVIDAYIGNTKVNDGKGQLSTIKVQLGQIIPSTLPSGATYWGYAEGLDIFTYDEWFIDDNGVEQPMIPVDMVCLGSSKARTAQHHGAIQDLKAVASVPYFPKTWEEEDPSALFLMLQSAPVVVPHQVDAFLFATVL